MVTFKIPKEHHKPNFIQPPVHTHAPRTPIPSQAIATAQYQHYPQLCLDGSSLQSPLLTRPTDRLLLHLPVHPPPSLLLRRRHFHIPYEKSPFLAKPASTLKTHKATFVILAPQRLDRQLIQYLRLALPAPRRRPLRMTPHAIRIIVPLHEWGVAVEWIAALGAEEVAYVPLRASGHDDFAFDRRLAGAAPRAEELVEVQVAVEAEWVVGSVRGKVGGFEAREPRGVEFWVEGDAFERSGAMVACEAFWVEAGFGGGRVGAAGGDDATRDGEGAG